MMKYCCHCGQETVSMIPPQDNRLRDVCVACETVHYQNPKIVAYTLPIWEEQVLLCRRAIGPRKDTWTLPGGYMEGGETIAEAAVRETAEEACAEVINPTLYLIANLVASSQVHIFYRGDLIAPVFSPGDETLETQLFSLEDIPWHLLSFRPVFYALRQYVEDTQKGVYPLHDIKLLAVPDGHFQLQAGPGK